jgi:hypothetical protein
LVERSGRIAEQIQTAAEHGVLHRVGDAEWVSRRE